MKDTHQLREALMGKSEDKKAPTALPRFSTGCDLLDLVVGGAPGAMGFPAGAIINLIGDKSAGKSFLKNEIIAASYHARGGKNFQWFSDDTETGDTFDTTHLYGFNIRPEERKIGGKAVQDTETVEELDAKVGIFLKSLDDEECGIYAVDSLDGLSDATKQKMAEAREGQLRAGTEVVDKGDYGAQIPKFLSQHFFRNHHAAIEKKNALLIIVSQIRDKFDAATFGVKWDVSGGKALEFFCHTRLFLTTIHKIMKGDRCVGVVVKAATIKSKTQRPFRQCTFTVYFDYGLDNIGTSLDYLYDLRGKDGTLLAAANSVAWDGKEGKTLESLRAWLKANEWGDECRKARKAQENNPNLSVEFILKWAESEPERKAALDKQFGQTMSRDALISAIERDPAMARELRRRVVEKWEAAEAAVATNRPGKYS